VTVPSRYRDLVLFVLLAALFGGSFVAIKTGLGSLPPIFFGGLRADVAAVAILAYAALTRSRSAWLPRTRGDVAGVLVGGVLLVAANNALLFLGQAATTPAAAAVMYGLNPVLAPLFAWLLLGQRLDGVSGVGIGIALAGVVVIVQPSPASFLAGDLSGQLFVLGAATAVALGSVGLRRAGAQLGSVPLTGWAMALGAVLLHGLSLTAGESVPTLTALPSVVLLAVLVLGLPSTALAFAIYFGLIDRVGPVRANFVSYVVPGFAAVTGWLLLGSSVSGWTVVGFVIVLAGFSIVERDVVRTELRRRSGRSVPIAATGGAVADADTTSAGDTAAGSSDNDYYRTRAGSVYAIDGGPPGSRSGSPSDHGAVCDD
jgi:drug/metabolite transporter (DMT)-like permease